MAIWALIGAVATGGCEPWPQPGPGMIMPSEQSVATRPAPAPSAPAERALRPSEVRVYEGLTPAPASALAPATTATAPAPATPASIAGDPNTEVVEAAVIQVNDKHITLQQVLQPLHDRLKVAAQAPALEAFRRAAADLIRQQIGYQVEQMLLYHDADVQLDDDSRKRIDEEVEKRLRRAVAECGGSRSALVAQLKAEGTDLEAWQDDVRQMVVVQAFLQDRLWPQVHVSRRMMQDFYNANLDRYQRPASVQMQIIDVPIQIAPGGDAAAYEQARREARAAIDKAKAALAAGEDFAGVARQHAKGPMASAGGVWPRIQRGSFKQEPVEQAAWAQEVGQVSDVIAAPWGFYIVKTLARDEARGQAFEEVQEQIQQELQRREQRRLLAEHLAKLRGKTIVVVADQLEPLAVDVAVRRYWRR